MTTLSTSSISYRTASLFVFLFLCVFESYDDPAVNQARRSAFGGSLRADLVRCAHPGTQYVPQRAESREPELQTEEKTHISSHCPALSCPPHLIYPAPPSLLLLSEKAGQIETLPTHPTLHSQGGTKTWAD